MSVSILLIEDEPDLQETLSQALQAAGYYVEAIGDGLLAIALARKLKPDLIVLDLLLPGLKGFEVYRFLRKEIDAPVLFLASCQDEIERLVALERHDVDCLLKPFSVQDFLARVRAYLPEIFLPQPETGHGFPIPVEQDWLGFGDLVINVKRGEVTLGGKLLRLKPKEYQLLHFLATHHGQTLSREFLLAGVWGPQYHGTSRTVDVHVRWLRQKIEAGAAKPKRIVTVRGGGYRFEG